MLAPNEERCRELAAKLRQVQVLPDEFLIRPESEEEKSSEANFWFYTVAICQHTKSLQGTLEGRWLRGWDYMVTAGRRAMTRDAQVFSAERVRRIIPQGLRTLYSDDGQPSRSTLDRVEERVEQLHQCAQLLLENYDGDVMNLYRRTGGRLRDKGGIMERLAQFEPYSDPVEKKSFLFLMFVSRAGIWHLKDLHNLKVAIDYHIMRIALRSGMVEVHDSALERALKERAEVSAEVDNRVRAAVRKACDHLIAHSGQDVFSVDNILWMMGRNCCFYDHDPFCGPNRCSQKGSCSFTSSVVYDCPGHCLFDGVCLGSLDEGYRRYWETTLHTHYY
jgi:hypothetical protein